MVITSGGIYGYLSGAYAETATQSEFLDKQVAIINQKRIRFEEQRIELKKSIVTWSEALTNPTTIQYVDRETGQLVTTTSSRQRQLLESQLKHANMRYNAVTDSITKLDVLILNAQINNESARELGPLQYIATLMDKPMDQIINWFMLLIIFVFDPLAIGMVVAANMAFAKLKYKNKEDYFKSRNEELKRKVKGSVPEGKKFGVWYPIPKEDSDSMDITDEDENRMNVIGQNGNDGLHYGKELKKDEVIEKEVTKEKPKPFVSTAWGNPGGRNMKK
jgi:hypothetical protein